MTKSHTVKELSPKELHHWMKEGPAFYLIDTLVEDHFRRIHLPDAFHACVFEITFIDQIKAITDDRNARIVLYGSSIRSMDVATASEKLLREGYRDVYRLKGGIQAWRSAGFPLEGEAVGEPDDPQTLLNLEDRSYRVDPDQSSIQWTGRNSTTSHVGNVRLTDGSLRVRNGRITGTFDIDMNSITNVNLAGDDLQPVLIGHLKSDDFFHSALFPDARFEILRASPIEKPFLSVPNYRVHGALVLKGVTAEQEFMATIANTTESGLAAEAHFDIDRTRWNVIYGSSRFFEHLGMHLVFDLISVQVRIIAS